MAQLSETALQIRRGFMKPALRDGTVPSVADLCRELSLSPAEFAKGIKQLEPAVCVALSDAANAGRTRWQDETLGQPLPAIGELFYPRPFAAFKNHYPIWVDGDQRWYAECAVEACAVSTVFPGQEVIVRSHCRQTKAPIELVQRDGVLLDYSPKTLRVHLGHPLREMPKDVLGWCDYNSFFASEEAARQWRMAHPAVHGITRSPENIASVMAEVVAKGRLEYAYQPTIPLCRVLLNLKRYGLTKSGPFGLPVLDPFWLPTPGMLREWKRQGWGFFVRFSLW